MHYRREIDGLRALAVLPVMLFHAGFDLFRGGYVGVDVFFVISGYLITSIILEEQNSGTFTIIRFYERRARRILPALFLVMATCIPLAWIYLPPNDMKDFSKSLTAISVFSSNILFWRQSGYFDTAAELKPLLHTWSLAVEEQYYLLFPPFIMLMSKLARRWMLGLFFFLAAISLAAAQWSAYHEPEAAFYLLPTRGWELAIGAFIAFYFTRQQQVAVGDTTRQVLTIAGLALVIAAVFAFDRNTPFPSLYALIPTLGTALVILFAAPATVVGRLLGSRPFVGIGLLSYSAYLWHQPLFAFARHRNLGEPGMAAYLTLIIVSIIIAYFSWRYIERPVRRGKTFKGKTIFAFALAGTLLFSSLGLLGDRDGFKSRFEFISKAFPDYAIDNRKLRQASWKTLRTLAGDNRYGVSDNNFDQTLWFSPDSNSIKVLIIGNSHSKDLFNVFWSNRKLFPHFEFARYGTALNCLDSQGKHAFYRAPNYKAADVILVSTKWSESQNCSGQKRTDFEGLENLISRAKQDNKVIAITSNTLEFPSSGTSTIADTIVIKSAAESSNTETDVKKQQLIRTVNAKYFQLRESLNTHITNETLREIAKVNNLIYLDKKELICNDPTSECLGLTDEFEKTFFDYGHYTVEGAKAFGLVAHRIGWLKPIEALFDMQRHETPIGMHQRQ